MAGWQEREHVSIKFPLETDHSHMLQQTHSPPPHPIQRGLRGCRDAAAPGQFVSSLVVTSATEGVLNL